MQTQFQTTSIFYEVVWDCDILLQEATHFFHIYNGFAVIALHPRHLCRKLLHIASVKGLWGLSFQELMDNHGFK